MKKWSYCAVVALVATGLVLPGCETGAGSAGAGAALGGIAGGLIGAESGKALEGAAIGAALGGLAGLIVHDVKTRRVRSREATVSDYEYTPDQQFMMDLRELSVSPESVYPGQQVTARTEYATLGTAGGARVQEHSVLLQDGRRVATLSDKEVIRDDGTWENLIVFEVPRNAAPGEYTVEQQLVAEGITRSDRDRFDVVRRVARITVLDADALASAK